MDVSMPHCATWLTRLCGPCGSGVGCGCAVMPVLVDADMQRTTAYATAPAGALREQQN
jgi:hypothetical protein